MNDRSGFFFYTALTMLVITLIGFAPTLYLRPFFDVPSIPPSLYLHGLVMTGWFVILVVQPYLIRSERIQMHRRLGGFFATYGIVVIVTGLFPPLGLVSRFVPSGVDLDADISVLSPDFGSGTPIIEFAARAVWVNISMLVAFGVLLSAAIVFRNRADAHKRLIILASLSVLGPALARIARWPIIGGEQGPFVPIVLVLFLIRIISFDLFTRKRVHVATILGIVLAVSVQILAARVASSEFGQALVRAAA